MLSFPSCLNLTFNKRDILFDSVCRKFSTSISNGVSVVSQKKTEYVDLKRISCKENGFKQKAEQIGCFLHREPVFLNIKTST